MLERSFDAKDENLSKVLEFIEGELENAGCSMRIQIAISVVIEEIFVNIAHYAYPDGDGSGTAKIAVDIDEAARVATFIVSDKGIAFDPLQKEDPDLTLPAEQREIGGLGILIIKKTMDSVEYIRENGENKLTMTKKF